EVNPETVWRIPNCGRTLERRAGASTAAIRLFGRICNTELNGSVFSDCRPCLRSPRRPDPPRRARTARRGQRDDQRARRALRHVADRDEEAHPAARGGAARHDGEGRPRPQGHARAVRLRGHQHLATAARPLRAGRRTNERSTMNTTTKKSKQSAKGSEKGAGFSAEEKAAMKERARELKAEARAGKSRAAGERALLASIAEMPEPDRA